MKQPPAWEDVMRLFSTAPRRARLSAGVALACIFLAPSGAAQTGGFFPTLTGNQQSQPPREIAPRPTSAGPADLGGFPRAAEAFVAPAPTPASYYSGYKIAAQDLLTVTIWDAPEFSRTLRVAPGGAIRLPLAKQAINVGGLTALECEQRVAQAMVDEGLLVDPIVAVTVLEFNGNPVQITGAVRSPTVMQAVGPTTLQSAILRAGGIVEDRAGPEIIIEKPDAATVRFPTREFAEGLNGVPDYPLTGGEKVRVEPAGAALIFGAVNRGGEFPIQTAEGIEFLELLSRAGGTRTEAGGKAIVLRPVGGPGGGRERIEVDLKKVLKYEVGDLRVHSGDIVYVPDARLKQFLQRVGETAVFHWLLRLVIL